MRFPNEACQETPLRVEKILAYLGLLRGQEQKRGSPTSPKKVWKLLLNLSMIAWPVYEETLIDVQAL